MNDDRAIHAQMLSAIRRDLGLVVMPDLRLGEARLKAGMMHDMLGHMIAWMDGGGAGDESGFQGHFDKAKRCMTFAFPYRSGRYSAWWG